MPFLMLSLLKVIPHHPRFSQYQQEWECGSVGRALNRHAADACSIPQCSKGFFSQSQLSVHTLLRCLCTPPCAIACSNICVHIKDPVVHVRVQWIMETLKHPACTVGWVAQLCCSWLTPGKATQISIGKSPNGTIELLTQNKQKTEN